MSGNYLIKLYMKSLQDIRIDIIKKSKEVRVNPKFEEKFLSLCKYLETEFGCPEIKLEDFELDKIDNSRFESDVLKCAICHAFKIPMYNNPWFNTFSILKTEDLLGYHGSLSDTMATTYDISFSSVIGFNIHNLLTVSDEQVEFIRTFKEKYQTLRENLEKLKKDCFPIIIKE